MFALATLLLIAATTSAAPTISPADTVTLFPAAENFGLDNLGAPAQSSTTAEPQVDPSAAANAAALNRPKDAPKPCCRAMTAPCLACAAGVTQAEYCAKKPRTVGCPVVEPTCALTRCKEGYTCIEGKGCVREAPKPCCRAMNAKCLACTEGKTVGEYCLANPKTVGCPVIEPKEPHMCIDQSPKFCQKRLGGQSGGHTAKLCGRKKFTRKCQQSCSLC